MYYPDRFVPESIFGFDMLRCKIVGNVDYDSLIGTEIPYGGSTYIVLSIDKIYKTSFSLKVQIKP